ncbi:hemolysin III family protein [Clostridium sp. BJN0001]|uniref:PAQR family membrane homeostasis protein TrhA n=1 Tax=Clostridium sp. BJN0001 TaxID=2930219 RepID=UPI001FD2E864|nr:hemolysin III family protein [Clostridium sp. BJN0001]
MNKYLREPVNCLTHLTGAVLSLFALIAMIIKAYTSNSSVITIVSVIIFGVSMILLYSASAAYHSVIAKPQIIKIFKKVDHSMIFILIAGSYTPFCLVALHGKIGLELFIAVSACAVLGIIFKIFWVTCPRWVSSTMYIAIGWFAIFAFFPIMHAISTLGIFYLVLGGVMYTIGGVIYALKTDKIRIGCFGRHEIFHVFIMIGTLCHFICIFNYVI